MFVKWLYLLRVFCLQLCLSGLGAFPIQLFFAFAAGTADRLVRGGYHTLQPKGIVKRSQGHNHLDGGADEDGHQAVRRLQRAGRLRLVRGLQRAGRLRLVRGLQRAGRLRLVRRLRLLGRLRLVRRVQLLGRVRLVRGLRLVGRLQQMPVDFRNYQGDVLVHPPVRRIVHHLPAFFYKQRNPGF